MAQPAGVRVLQVVCRMDRGGAETWLMHMLRYASPPLEMDFLVHTAGDAAYDEEILGMGSRILRCPDPRTRPVGYTPALLRVLREEGPYDVIHCHLHEFNGWVLMAARLAGISARIAHSHASSEIMHIEAERNPASRLRGALMRGLIRRHATLGLAASRGAAAALFGRRWSADPRWRVFHCGIDLEPFMCPRPERGSVLREFGIPGDAFVVGHVGRFVPAKNHRFLLEFAAIAAARDPSFYLLLVGDGELRPMIEARLDQLGLTGRVIIAGSRADVPRLLLGAMDLLVLPSLTEALPLVVLEAQAAGLPVLASDVVIDDAIVADGLVRRMSLSAPAHAWADALLGSPRGSGAERPSSARPVLCGDRFDARVSARNLEQIYRTLTRPGRDDQDPESRLSGERPRSKEAG